MVVRFPEDEEIEEKEDELLADKEILMLQDKVKEDGMVKEKEGGDEIDFPYVSLSLSAAERFAAYRQGEVYFSIHIPIFVITLNLLYTECILLSFYMK